MICAEPRVSVLFPSFVMVNAYVSLVLSMTDVGVIDAVYRSGPLPEAAAGYENDKQRGQQCRAAHDKRRPTPSMPHSPPLPLHRSQAELVSRRRRAYDKPWRLVNPHQFVSVAAPVATALNGSIPSR